MSVHTQIAKSIVIAVAVLGLASCGQRQGKAHWQEVRELDAPTSQIHFVVVEPAFAHDKSVYEDAVATLCPSDGCNIEFFPTMKDAPAETTFEEYRDNGYASKHTVNAAFGRSTFFAPDGMSWDCNRFPQQYLDNCIAGTNPVASDSVAARQRGALAGFRKVSFGMPLKRVVAALGGDDAVTISGDAGSEIAHGKIDLHGRSFIAAYDLQDARLTSAVFEWSDSIDKPACGQETKKIAQDLQKDYGKEDGFNYFDAGSGTMKYQWYFADGGRISVSNVQMTEGNCTVDVSVSSKASLAYAP